VVSPAPAGDDALTLLSFRRALRRESDLHRRPPPNSPVRGAGLCPAIQTAALKVHVEGAGIVSKSGSQEDTRRAALRRGRSAAKQRSSALRHGASAPSGALRPRRSAALLQVLEIDTGISSQNPPPFMSTQLPGKAHLRERGRLRGGPGRGRRRAGAARTHPLQTWRRRRRQCPSPIALVGSRGGGAKPAAGLTLPGGVPPVVGSDERWSARRRATGAARAVAYCLCAAWVDLSVPTVRFIHPMIL